MTPSDLRHRLQVAGWHLVDLPGHHAMAWTAIDDGVVVTARRDGSVVGTLHYTDGATVQVQGSAAGVLALLRVLRPGLMGEVGR